MVHTRHQQTHEHEAKHHVHQWLRKVQFLQIIDGEFFIFFELKERLHKDVVVVAVAGSYAFEAYIRDPLEVVRARLLGNGLSNFLSASGKYLLLYL